MSSNVPAPVEQPPQDDQCAARSGTQEAAYRSAENAPVVAHAYVILEGSVELENFG